MSRVCLEQSKDDCRNGDRMKTIQRAVYVILLCAVLCITGCSQSQKTDQAAGDEKPAVSSDASNAAGSEVPAASHVQMLDYNKDLTRSGTLMAFAPNWIT